MSTVWRAAGWTYNKYLTQATTFARKVVKENVQPKYQVREGFHYGRTVYKNGLPENGGKKQIFTTMEANTL